MGAPSGTDTPGPAETLDQVDASDRIDDDESAEPEETHDAPVEQAEQVAAPVAIEVPAEPPRVELAAPHVERAAPATADPVAVPPASPDRADHDPQ